LKGIGIIMKKILAILSIFCLAALIVGVASAANDTPKQPPQNCTDFAKAAKTLGITEDKLKAAMGTPGAGQGPDTAALAKKLGVTEDALKKAMESQAQGKPDNAALAKALGISEDKVKEAMGTPGQGAPDDKKGSGMFTEAATKLGIKEDALKAALDAAKTC
jgi:hypothetical protein